MHRPSTFIRRCRSVLSLLAIICLAPHNTEGHPALTRQIEEITRQISVNQSNAQLYLKRASLYLEHRDWQKSLADLDTVETLSPESTTYFLRARIAFARENFGTARQTIDRFLNQNSEHVKGNLLRARILSATGEYDAAAESYSHCISISQRPDPEWYVERARARSFGATEELSAAISELDEGIAKFGPLVTLQIEKIQLTLMMADTAGAINQLDRLIASTPRPEQWLFRKGQLLQTIGKVEAAKSAYQASLQQVAKLPSRHRRTLAMSRLKGDCRAALTQLENQSENHRDTAIE